MIQAIIIYKKNKENIERFLLDNISNNVTNELTDKHLSSFFKTFKSLQMLYVTDDNYQQSKAKLIRDKKDTAPLPIDRIVTFEKRVIKGGKYVSSPYVSISTGRTIITVIKKIEKNYLVMDFDLIDLLEELNYVTHGTFFIKTNKFFYATIGYGLYLLSAILILYSILTFGSYLLYYDSTLIEATFKSIVSITLGLAIFDLGKNLLEHEVIYRQEAEKGNSSRVFIKFLISIIVAISIEGLIFIFKIILSKEYSDMTYAFYLIAGVSMFIISLSIFSKLSRS
ncbi:hypothetical protein M947_01890 [Sulfurimonas hongkongensis]|uniref:N-linked glycosylation glycosyltransferase PglG n=1 Tax=Sulfurimonas hongkongensis TaxID=1172190 RepID=T0KUB5_9BACT|nr:hypothetical protein [Sulfurimonas hongkongensis]EQB40579.1 hypothetical protein M947_01890 [Sulfurimonas hongkongensis]